MGKSGKRGNFRKRQEKWEKEGNKENIRKKPGEIWEKEDEKRAPVKILGSTYNVNCNNDIRASGHWPIGMREEPDKFRSSRSHG